MDQDTLAAPAARAILNRMATLMVCYARAGLDMVGASK